MAAQDATLTVDPLNLATLYLCNLSYARDITTIPQLVQKTPILGAGGQWTCLWGPGQSPSQSNLAFVAGYSPKPGAAVQSICVTIRGTNIFLGEDIWGIILQLWQDLDATSQVNFFGGKIAQGTSDGLTVIQGLTDPKTNVSLEQYLKGFLGTASNANVTSIVTGHSLGGCLATVVAPWIELMRPATYKGTIQPITFAGPTAGNSDFATNYDSKFQTARRFQNTLDVIPLAYQNLPKIVDIYSPNGLDAPDPVWLGIYGMYAALLYNEVSYVQPSVGAQMLPGIFFTADQNDWYAQAFHQHHPAVYLGLLLHTPVDVLSLPHPITTLSREARLAKRIGPVDDALKRLAMPRAAE
jgi:hypothetical protein